MASLTGQQIQNSYEGLLKTENNGALPNTETNITDGVGTQTGLYTENQYGIAGYKGVNAFPQWAIKNTNFDLNNSPLGASGASQLSFTDANSFKTASIVQNRFGGITYFNSVDGQSHIFGGTNNNSPIRIDAYNSPNNSDNWYTGYNQSPDSLSFDTGTRDLTLGRTNTPDLVVNIPGGGGSSYSYSQDQYFTPGAYDGGIGPTYSFFTNTIIFYPIMLGSGTLNEVAIQVESTSAAASDTRLVLYSPGNTTSSTHPSGTPSTLVADFGVIDTSVGGLVTISTNVSIDQGLYYYGIYQEGPWDASYRVFDRGGGQSGRLAQNRISEDAILNTGSSFNAFYTNVGAAWTPPTTFTGSLAQSSDNSSMYFKIS